MRVFEIGDRVEVDAIIMGLTTCKGLGSVCDAKFMGQPAMPFYIVQMDSGRKSHFWGSEMRKLSLLELIAEAANGAD